MADHSNPVSDTESSNEEDFYRMLEEYTQQVRLRYHIPIRMDLPRAYASRKKAAKGYLEDK